MKAEQLKTYISKADEIKVKVDLGNGQRQYFNATKKDLRFMLKRFAGDAHIEAHYNRFNKVLTVGENAVAAVKV